MANKTNYSDRIRNIERHVDVINSELGGVQKEMAAMGTNFSWMKWIISGNVLLWILVLGKMVTGG